MREEWITFWTSFMEDQQNSILWLKENWLIKPIWKIIPQLPLSKKNPFLQFCSIIEKTNNLQLLKKSSQKVTG